jgi:hypothetical protein
MTFVLLFVGGFCHPGFVAVAQQITGGISVDVSVTDVRLRPVVR